MNLQGNEGEGGEGRGGGKLTLHRPTVFLSLHHGSDRLAGSSNETNSKLPFSCFFPLLRLRERSIIIWEKSEEVVVGIDKPTVQLSSYLKVEPKCLLFHNLLEEYRKE